jgi:hypothetical protein
VEDEFFSGGVRRQEIQKTLAPRLISEPLKSKIDSELLRRRDLSAAGLQPPVPESFYEVIIELNLNNPRGRTGARGAIWDLLHSILGADAKNALNRNLEDSTHPYIFATLTAAQINELITRDSKAARTLAAAKIDVPNMGIDSAQPQPAVSASNLVSEHPTHPPLQTAPTPISRRTLRSIFRIWESQKVHPLTTESVRTVKANAAHNSFGALGEDIVWAVLDSGIDASHQHFKVHDNINLAPPLTDRSRSFIVTPALGIRTHLAMAPMLPASSLANRRPAPCRKPPSSPQTKVETASIICRRS